MTRVFADRVMVDMKRSSAGASCADRFSSASRSAASLSVGPAGGDQASERGLLVGEPLADRGLDLVVAA